MIAFCESYILRNLIKQPTCFRNPDNPKYELFRHTLKGGPGPGPSEKAITKFYNKIHNKNI